MGAFPLHLTSPQESVGGRGDHGGPLSFGQAESSVHGPWRDEPTQRAWLTRLTGGSIEPERIGVKRIGLAASSRGFPFRPPSAVKRCRIRNRRDRGVAGHPERAPSVAQGQS